MKINLTFSNLFSDGHDNSNVKLAITGSPIEYANKKSFTHRVNLYSENSRFDLYMIAVNMILQLKFLPLTNTIIN